MDAETDERDDEDEQDEREMAVMKSHVAQLSEHFDVVQILASRHVGATTTNWQFGAGNWFARYGLARMWLVREEEEARRESCS